MPWRTSFLMSGPYSVSKRVLPVAAAMASFSSRVQRFTDSRSCAISAASRWVKFTT
ncbi:MAG: hypothetical protein U0168_15315 [Nannocystaceae bacterium]